MPSADGNQTAMPDAITVEIIRAALNAAAERIEKSTQVLNRTVGGGIAIG